MTHKPLVGMRNHLTHPLFFSRKLDSGCGQLQSFIEQLGVQFYRTVQVFFFYSEVSNHAKLSIIFVRVLVASGAKCFASFRRHHPASRPESW